MHQGRAAVTHLERVAMPFGGKLLLGMVGPNPDAFKPERSSSDECECEPTVEVRNLG